MRRVAALAFAVVLGSPASAWAAEPQRVMVLPLQVEGEMNPGWSAKLAVGVSEGLERGDFELVAGVAGECGDPGCFMKLAAAAPADFLVRSIVTAGADRTYTVRLELIAGSTGEVVVEATEVCELCGFNEVRDLVADESATLRTKIDDLVKGAPVFVIETIPDGARVLIDGEEVGVSPLHREVLAGRHITRAEKEGYAPLERDVLALDGVEERIVLELQPLPKRERNLRPVAWVGLGIGIVGVAAGATFFALDERPAPGDRCTGMNVDVDGDCRFRYDTIGEAIGLTAAGVVVTVAAAVVLGLTSKKRRSGNVALTPSGVRF